MGEKTGREYAWLMLWALARFRGGDDGLSGSDMVQIDAVGGQLRGTPTRAANDIAARLFILLIFLGWLCAKNSANSSAPYPVWCKMPPSQIFAPIPLYPAWLRLIPVMALVLSLVPKLPPPHSRRNERRGFRRFAAPIRRRASATRGRADLRRAVFGRDDDGRSPEGCLAAPIPVARSSALAGYSEGIGHGVAQGTAASRCRWRLLAI